MLMYLAIALTFAAPEPDPADAGRPYVFQLKGGEAVYGFTTQDIRKAPVFHVEIDEPWAPPRTERIRRSELVEEPYLESRLHRENRHRDDAGEAGYQRVNGTFYPVAEIEAAEWARRAAKERKSPAAGLRGNLPTGTVNALAIDPPAQEEPSGFWARWGWHVLVITGALVLAALVAKFTFFA